MAGKGGFYIEWQRSPEQAAQGMRRLGEALKTSIYSAMAGTSPEAEEHMKETRPWQDVTGNARRGLKVQTERTSDTLTTMTFYHQVSYGVHLEFSRGGRYAVIVPSVYWAVPRVRSAIVKEANRAVNSV